jgi:thiamine-phosphate pyrophosphorylase
LDVAALEAEVHRLSGHQPGPLPFESEEETTDEPPAQALEVVSEHELVGVLRIVDAAANRAAEGLRVVEDFLRFVLDDRHLTSICKQMRHDLAAALAAISSADRHRARETRGDVGVEMSLPSEQARAGAVAVVEASFKRVEQALRSLEEFGKTLDAGAAATFERLRYRAYTLERAVDITRTSCQRLAGARLYVLVDGGEDEQRFGALVRTLVAAGASIVQLRDKRLADRELLRRARLLRELTRDTATLAIINDRPDLCVLSEADGVHVGQDELTVKDARRIVGPSALVGVSTHSIEQARTAVLDGADYIGVGPTFPSETKQFTGFAGVELLRAVSAEIRLPAFAIGGITAANVGQVRAAGFTRVAVSAAVTAASDPGQAAAQLRAALDD